MFEKEKFLSRLRLRGPGGTTVPGVQLDACPLLVESAEALVLGRPGAGAGVKLRSADRLERKGPGLTADGF
jgi:hypothetical protein